MKTKTHIITIQNSGENFLEQQFWLYLNGVLVASLVHIVSSSYLTPGLVPTYLQSTNTKVLVSVVLGLLFSSLGGLVVAAILKKLDNVVKEYSYAIANLFTALISAVLFPDKFQFSSSWPWDCCSQGFISTRTRASTRPLARKVTVIVIKSKDQTYKFSKWSFYNYLLLHYLYLHG